MDEWLDRLIEHEVLYTSMIAQTTRTDDAWFLHSPSAPDYRDGNRAMRLRTAERSAGEIVEQIIRYYRDRDLPPTADLDPVSESQGFEQALRQAGMLPTPGNRLLMRYSASTAEHQNQNLGGPGRLSGLSGQIGPISPSHTLTPSPSQKTTSPPPHPITSSPHHLITITEIPNEAGHDEAAVWIETAVSDDLGYPDESLWRKVARHEAAYAKCRLYLARVGGIAAGTCSLFEASEWGRIDSVVTRREYRRQGVASALIARAAQDSVTHGNRETYLFTERGGDAERLYRRLGFAAWHLDVFRQYRMEL
jgi:GNAT superfamily N-acetyltransferase